MHNYRLLEVDFKDNYGMCIKVQANYDWTIPEVSDFVNDVVKEHGEVVRIIPISEDDAKKFYDLNNINDWKMLTKDGLDTEKKLKLEYEKYKLQWMIEHNYTIPDLINGLQMLFDRCLRNPALPFQQIFESWERTEEGFNNHELYPNYKTWLETIALKDKVISIPAIEEAYFRGILKVVPDNLMSSPICEIGGHQFYFVNTNNDKGIIREYRDYLKNTLLSDIFSQIFNALCEMEHSDHQEFIYYYLYLEDKLGQV